MMKGKIILVDVTHPVEGNIYVNKGLLVDKWWRIERSQLKQIAVEYQSAGATDESGRDIPKYAEFKILPLHPSQWNVGIALIGHEVEIKLFTIEHPLWRSGKSKDSIMDVVEIVLPTPVRTINDIPEELRKNYTPCPRCGKGFLTYSEEKDDVFCSNCPYPEYPVEESWHDISVRFMKSIGHSKHLDGFMTFLEQNYLPPNRKV